MCMNFTLEPYRVLFPLGALHAVIGTGGWIAYALHLGPYPGQDHALQMIGGFLFSFAMGFLFTAIPRFTGSHSSSAMETALAVFLSGLLFFWSHPVVLFLMLALMLAFFAIRTARSSHAAPHEFVFIPLGLVAGMFGALALALVRSGHLGAEHVPAAKHLLYQGTMLALLLGIGAKLLAALLGWNEPPLHKIGRFGTPPTRLQLFTSRNAIPRGQAGLLLAGFGCVSLLQRSLGLALVALCASWIGIWNWKLHRRPRADGKLPFWIWVSGWMLIAALWMQALLPDLGVHASHVVLITGVSLLTLLVASRVTLAHGGHPLEIERRSHVFWVCSTLTILAAATRLSAQWTASYFAHLSYAAATWIAAVIVWSAMFLPLIFSNARRGTPPDT